MFKHLVFAVVLLFLPFSEQIVKWELIFNSTALKSRSGPAFYVHNNTLFYGGGIRNGLSGQETLTDLYSSQDGVTWTLTNGNTPGWMRPVKVVNLNSSYSLMWGGLNASTVMADDTIWGTTDGVHWSSTGAGFPESIFVSPMNFAIYSNLTIPSTLFSVKPYTPMNCIIEKLDDGYWYIIAGGGYTKGEYTTPEYPQHKAYYILRENQYSVKTLDFVNFIRLNDSANLTTPEFPVKIDDFTQLQSVNLFRNGTLTSGGGAWINGSWVYFGYHGHLTYGNPLYRSTLLAAWKSTDGVEFYVGPTMSLPVAIPAGAGSRGSGRRPYDFLGKGFAGIQKFNGSLHVFGGYEFMEIEEIDRERPHHYYFDGTDWTLVCGNDCPFNVDRNQSCFKTAIFRDRMVFMSSERFDYDVGGFYYYETIRRPQIEAVADGVNTPTQMWAYGEADDCLLYDVHCLNGGTCVDGLLTYHCACIPGYEGVTCQTEINECQSTPCQNSGTCTDLLNGFNCTCVAGYTGTLCAENINDCNATTCNSHGTCQDGITSYLCVCDPGYTGVNCQTDINECAILPAPCTVVAADANYTHNGTVYPPGHAGHVTSGACVDEVNAYHCRYTFPYGVCNDLPAGRVCTCTAGYGGVNCQDDIDECIVNSPCPASFASNVTYTYNGTLYKAGVYVNITCVNLINDYACVYDFSFPNAALSVAPCLALILLFSILAVLY